MPIEFLTAALLAVSLLTNATVEALKKLFSETQINYSSNLLAVIVSIIMSCAISAGYMILNGVPFSIQIGVQIVILTYLSFLVATIGYDKIVQMLAQIMQAIKK